MEKNLITICIVILNFLGRIHFILCTCATLRLSRDTSFDGLTCPSADVVINAENVQSAATCAAICTKAPSCVGVFYQPLIKECYGCTSIYKDDAPSLAGTKFYGRGCFELPTIADGTTVFDQVVSEYSVAANVVCDSWYLSRKQTIYCDADSGWETATCADCYLEEKVGYAGKRNWTVSGFTCQRWDVQTPQEHDVGDKGDNFPDDTINDAENYCRYPGKGEDEPWCYTVEPNVRWEYCGISKCD